MIFADIVGLDELTAELTSDELLAIVNKLTRQFDAAAENLGVEQVRTLHNGYLASCGLACRASTTSAAPSTSPSKCSVSSSDSTSRPATT